MPELVNKFPKKPYSPFPINNLYGLGSELKKYGNYPGFLPLCVYTDHGISSADIVPPHEMEHHAPCIFFYNNGKVNDWKSKTKKPCYVVPAPFVCYRKRKEIIQDTNATGSIYFVAHSTSNIDVTNEESEFIDFILNLPEQFQPVSVCLHPADVIKKRHLPYIEAGLNIYCAGHNSDMRFIERFYGILKKFKYSLSNELGSYLFYSVEMGIPFSWVGPEVVYFNKTDDNVNKGIYKPNTTKLELEKRKLFKGFHTEINKAQMEFVRENLGLNNGLSPEEVNKILYQSLIEYYKFRIPDALKNPASLFVSIGGRLKGMLSRLQF